MVKIFAAGDFHGDILQAKKLAKQALKEGAELIILNGDIVEEDKIDGVVGQFTATGKPIIMVPGNHDFLATEFLALKYNATNLHGKSKQHEHIGIIGCGGANVGLHQLTEEEIYNTIKEANKNVKSARKKILVTHVHPAKTKMEQFSHFVRGSTGLRKAIEAIKPDIVLCGHVHEAEGIEEKIGSTTVINVGRKGTLLDV